MKELNDVEKKEIEIKQKRLQTLLSIDKLVDSADADSVDTDDILNYSYVEKNSLVLDILNSLYITDFDEIYEDGGDTVYLGIENTLKHFNKAKRRNIVETTIYNEFVSALANYDVSDLLGYEIIQNYLKIISDITLYYDDIDLSCCKTV